MDAAYLLYRMAAVGSQLRVGSEKWDNFADFNSDLQGPRGGGMAPILVPTITELIESEGCDFTTFRDVCSTAIYKAKSSVPNAPRSFGWTGGCLRSLLTRVHERYQEAVKPSVCIWFLTDCRRDYHRERLLDAKAFLREKARNDSSLQGRQVQEAVDIVEKEEEEREASELKVFHDLAFDFEVRFKKLLDEMPDELTKDLRGIYFAFRDKESHLEFAENTDGRLLKLFGFNDYNAQMAAFFAGDFI